MSLYNKIKNKEARIGVIGLGYVGLPLAVEFAKTGFNVTGIEVDNKKIASINNGLIYSGITENFALQDFNLKDSFQSGTINFLIEQYFLKRTK